MTDPTPPTPADPSGEGSALLVPDLDGVPEDDDAEPADAEPGPDSRAIPEDLLDRGRP